VNLEYLFGPLELFQPGVIFSWKSSAMLLTFSYQAPVQPANAKLDKQFS
jgi:hypothetical protein